MALTLEQGLYFAKKSTDASKVLDQVSYKTTFFGYNTHMPKMELPPSSFAAWLNNVANVFRTYWNEMVRSFANDVLHNDHMQGKTNLRAITGFFLELLAKAVYYLAKAGEAIESLFGCGEKPAAEGPK